MFSCLPSSSSASLRSFRRDSPAPAAPATRLDLHSGWQLQSACVLQGSSTGPAGLKDNAYPSLDGEILSSPLYRPIGWIPATVPTTVVAAQVAAGIIKDPFYGMNLRKLPGMDYPIGSQFANLAMLDDSPYKCGWWYRTQFRLPAGFAGRTVALHLDGVNYRADVWLNGKQIASKNDIAGTWRVFELNLTSGLSTSKENVLAIEVFPPTPDDLAITWVDWNPAPPDKNTGLFRDVYLTASGPVQLRFPYVANKLDDNFTTAQLTPVVEAWNATGHAGKSRHRMGDRRQEDPSGSRARRRAEEDRHLRAGTVPRAHHQEPQAVVARATRHAHALPRSRQRHGGRQALRIARRDLRHSPGHLGDEQPAHAVQDQRQAHPHSRRRLGARHASALLAAAHGHRISLRARSRTEHHPPRRQTREPGVLRPRRQVRHPHHGGMVLLRYVGALERVGP